MGGRPEGGTINLTNIEELGASKAAHFCWVVHSNSEIRI